MAEMNLIKRNKNTRLQMHHLINIFKLLLAVYELIIQYCVFIPPVSAAWQQMIGVCFSACAKL